MFGLLMVLVTSAHAESWCAAPVVAHEWGVQSFRLDGGTPEGLAIPDAYHRRPGTPRKVARVVDMPVDGGNRCLPVVHFYANNNFGADIPIAIDVGFTQGEASVWYPQVDRLQTDSGTDVQLGWDSLTLRAEPQGDHVSTDVPWVSELRGFNDALWVEHDNESERFVFYEADTHESPAVRISRSRASTSERPHLLAHNDGQAPVHDVLVVHRDGDTVWSARIPIIQPGHTASAVAQPNSTGEAWLRERITDTEAVLADDIALDWSQECVMMRNPAEPFTAADDHRLYPHEVDALMTAWQGRFFDDEGTRVVYREDTASLQANMPLSIYTDMYHYVTLQRLGLTLVEGITLL